MTTWRKKPDNNNPTSTCECGRSKPTERAACERCLFLDGENRCTQRDAELIEALRHELDMQPASTVEIAEVTGRGVKQVKAACERLSKAGRLRKFWEDLEVTPPRSTSSKMEGLRGGRFVGGGPSLQTGRWMYALSAP